MWNVKRGLGGCIALLGCSMAFAQPLLFVTEDYPPFNFVSPESGAVTGMSTELLVEMAKRARIEASVGVFPWKRALVMAKQDKNTCVFSAIRNAEREPDYKWIGPLISDNLALFARADSSITLKTLDDARKYKVGTYNGSLAIPLLAEHEVPMDIAPNDQANLRKLAIGRIDLWVASLRTGLYMAKRAGIVAVKPVLTIGNANDFQMYLACGKTMPDDTVAQLNAILKKMRSDGTFAKIQSRYE